MVLVSKSKAAYDKIVDDIADVELRIEGLEEQKNALRDERAKIGEALGFDKEFYKELSVIQSEDKPPRIKIRPRVMTILKTLRENEEYMSVDEIFGMIKEDIPSVRRPSFDGAIRRMVADGAISLINKDEDVFLELK